jgi:hypothetical protein
LHISDFIMVPSSISNQVPTESQSPQSEVSTSNSNNDAPLWIPNQDSVPPWIDNSAPPHDEFPSKDSLHLSIEIENAIPSQGSSPHVDNALGHSNILYAKKMPEVALQSPTGLDEGNCIGDEGESYDARSGEPSQAEGKPFISHGEFEGGTLVCEYP